MNFTAYSLFALPLWAALFALYFILRREGLARPSLIAKCAGTFLAAASAGLSLFLRGENPLAAPYFWFFVLCMGADALLEIHFVPGMLLFGGAHGCLIFWYLHQARFPWWTLLVWLAALAAAVFLFRRELPTLGKLAPAFVGYAALLGATLSLGLTLPFQASGALPWVLAVGGLCFYVSDMMVARMELAHLAEKWQKPVMVLYWLALYLLSSWYWFPGI